MNNAIHDLLEYYIGQYESPTEITEGYNFDMPNTINMIELYYAGKFKTGDRDSQGNKKYFFNIVKPQCGHATKNLDIDRSEILVKPERNKDRVKAMLYNDRLKYWMKQNRFNIFLNNIGEKLPIYGSVVARKVGSEIRLVPLSKLKIEPSLSNNNKDHNINSSFIIEEHNMSASELEKMKAKGWDAEVVDKVVSEMRKEKESTECVYEMYAETPDENGKYNLTVSFLTEDGELFYNKKVEDAKYKKFDMFTVEGRALGMGIVEMLTDIQIRRNEMANQKADSMRVTSKALLQTKDSNVEGNILQDVLNGDIIIADYPITQIDISERNLGSFAQEEANLMKDTRDLTNAREIVTGDSLPSRTPYRLGVLQLQQASKLYEFIKERMSGFVEEICEDWVLTDFEKDVDTEMVFEIYDSKTLREVVEADVNRRLNNAIKKIVLSTGYFPSKEEVDAVKQTMMQDVDKPQFVKIIKGYFKDFKKTLYVDITGEQHNAAQEVETMTNMIQLLAQNPQIMQDPQLKEFLMAIASKTGIDPSLLPSNQGNAQLPALNQVAPLGGQVPLAQG